MRGSRELSISATTYIDRLRASDPPWTTTRAARTSYLLVIQREQRDHWLERSEGSGGARWARLRRPELRGLHLGDAGEHAQRRHVAHHRHLLARDVDVEDEPSDQETMTLELKLDGGGELAVGVEMKLELRRADEHEGNRGGREVDSFRQI